MDIEKIWTNNKPDLIFLMYVVTLLGMLTTFKYVAK